MSTIANQVKELVRVAYNATRLNREHVTVNRGQGVGLNIKYSLTENRWLRGNGAVMFLRVRRSSTELNVLPCSPATSLSFTLYFYTYSTQAEIRIPTYTLTRFHCNVLESCLLQVTFPQCLLQADQFHGPRRAAPWCHRTEDQPAQS